MDVATSEEAKMRIRRKSGGVTELPQIFTDGEYRGVFDDFEYASESHQLLQFLAFDRTRAFVPRHKTSSDHGEHEFSSSSLAQDGEDAEQGAGLPSLVVNGLGNRSTAGGLYGHKTAHAGGKSDLATSKYLLTPGSSQFPTTSSLSSNGPSRLGLGKKPGFVQSASQVWDGALKSDITHAKHDLGFGTSTVMPDDDELEELYEKGAVSEAELEAMLASVNA